MKSPLAAAFAALIFSAQGAHAEIPARTLPEVVAFVKSSTHCSVLTGGADWEGDGADRTYSESLNKALTAIGGALPLAAELMRSACAHRSTPSASSAGVTP